MSNIKKVLLVGLCLSLSEIARSQTLATLTDIGATAPVPGPNDISQLSISGYSSSPDGLNYYINNSPGCGQTFTTGNSPTGYQLNSLSIQTAGGGGGGVTSAQAYNLWIYAVSGTNATLVASYTSQNTFTFVETDWLQWSGLAVPLLPNTTYAYAIRDTVTSSWESLYSASGNPYAGGELALIPPAGGVITFGSSHGFDATFDVGLSLGTGVPQISSQPASKILYPGETAKFSFIASYVAPSPLTYYWQKTTGSGTVNLVDGGNISGASGTLSTSGAITNSLNIGNVVAGDVASYQVVVTNSYGSTASSVVTLALGTPTGEGYEIAMLTNDPVAYWQLNEVNDGSGTLIAHDYVGGFDGAYEPTASSGPGPQTAEGFPGFGDANSAASIFLNYNNTAIDVPPLNLNTNTVTISAWVNPYSGQTGNNGIFFCRGGSTVAGLTYSGSQDANGNFTLGYTWNNEAGTYNWNSGLVPPLNQWSFVTLVVTPTAATIYVINTNSLLSATHVYPHVIQSFSAASQIGHDPQGGTGRDFDGYLDEVAVFDRALSQDEVVNLYAAASGSAPLVSPAINTQPQSLVSYAGQTAQFAVQASGNPAVSYQWKAGAIGSGTYTNLVNNGKISGVNLPTLTISNVASADALGYVVVVSNSLAAITSAPATLTVVLNYVQSGWNLQLPSNPTNWDHNGVVIKASNVGPNNSSTPPNIQAVGISGITFDTDLSNIPNVTNGLPATAGSNYITSTNLIAGTDFYSITDPNVLNLFETWLEFDSWASPNNCNINFTGLVIGHTYEFQAMLGFGWSYSAFNLYGALGEYTYFSDDDTLGDSSIGKAIYTWTAISTNAAINLGINTDNSAQGVLFGYMLMDVPNLKIQSTGSSYVLSWTYGTLLQSDTVNGTYAPVSGATPPSYTATPGGAQKFYRVQVSP